MRQTSVFVSKLNGRGRRESARVREREQAAVIAVSHARHNERGSERGVCTAKVAITRNALSGPLWPDVRLAAAAREENAHDAIRNKIVRAVLEHNVEAERRGGVAREGLVEAEGKQR